MGSYGEKYASEASQIRGYYPRAKTTLYTDLCVTSVDSKIQASIHTIIQSNLTTHVLFCLLRTRKDFFIKKKNLYIKKKDKYGERSQMCPFHSVSWNKSFTNAVRNCTLVDHIVHICNAFKAYFSPWDMGYSFHCCTLIFFWYTAQMYSTNAKHKTPEAAHVWFHTRCSINKLSALS